MVSYNFTLFHNNFLFLFQHHTYYQELCPRGYDWGYDSVVTFPFCSYSGSECVSQHLNDSFPISVTFFPKDTMFSSELHGHQAHTQCTYIPVRQILIYKMKIKSKKFNSFFFNFKCSETKYMNQKIIAVPIFFNKYFIYVSRN